MVQEPVEQRRGDDGVTEDLAPFGEASVRRQDHGAFFIAGVDELEEQIAAAGDHGQVADLVDDEQGEAAEESDPLAQDALAFGLGERADEIGKGGEVDAAAGFDGLHPERQAQVAFARAGRTSVIMPGVCDLRWRSFTRSIRDAERQSSLSPASGLGVRRILLSDNLTPR